jgi:hypothetical protein
METNEIIELLLSGNDSRLIGLPESEHLECKVQPYDLSQDFNKRELAKDVSAFANTDGGLIIIGAKTKKSQENLGDEIEALRPMEQRLLDTERYHNVIQEWIYPSVENVKIQFCEQENSQKGIFIIEIPKQREELKPFLIKRLVDQPKSAEIIFGFVQRQRSNNKPLSITELQNALRKGFQYERHLEQQAKLEALPLFRNENAKVKQLVIEKPPYWEYLLTEELLRSRFRQICLELTDLQRGAVLRKHHIVDRPQFFRWLETKWPEAQAAVAVLEDCVNNGFKKAWGQTGENPSDANLIITVVDKLHSACNFLLEWEADVFSIHPPEPLEPVKNALMGSMIDILEELEKLSDHLAEAVQRGQQHTGPEPLIHSATVNFRFTRAQLISDALDEVKRNAPWTE